MRQDGPRISARRCFAGGAKESTTLADEVTSGVHWSIAPYLIVDDVVASANYYR
jgi:hypothetical protein